MIICLRTVEVPEGERPRFMQWINANREVREKHGILFELVLSGGEADPGYTVATAWPSHEVFDAWIATPERDELTESAVHKSMHFHPITRYDVVAGYVNTHALAKEERT